MASRALLIGSARIVKSENTVLQGVQNDVFLMKDVLRERHFEVEALLDEEATRGGILAGYDRLIESSRRGDAAVVYYSGHGFHASASGRAWQCIAPFDTALGGVHDWRGITAWELSIKQAQLTKRTENVTVVLDCCHASHMSRDAAVRDAVPRALPHPQRIGFEAHLGVLREMYGQAFDEVAVTGNPHAVRLVACGQEESAFEYLNDEGRYYGAFTEALGQVLRGLGAAQVSWRTIRDAIRPIVVGKFADQHPEVEGPERRHLFSLTLEDSSGVVAVERSGDRFGLPVGKLTGVTAGDVYGVMPAGATAYDHRTAVAQVEVTEVLPFNATAVLRGWENGHQALPLGAVAVPRVQGARRHAVAIDVPDCAREPVCAAIAASRTLRVARPGEESGALATLRLDDRGLTIGDALGPLFPPARFPDELEPTIKNITNLGVGRSLGELEGNHGVFHPGEFTVELGVVEQGQERQLPARAGCALGLGDRIYVEIRNVGRRQLFAHVFNVGVRGRVTLLTSFAPTGVCLNSGDPPFVLGRGPDGTPRGLRLSWPEGLGRETFPRRDQIAVIVTTARTSLRTLEMQEHLPRSGRRSAGTGLQDLLAQLQDGLTREITNEKPVDEFCLKILSYVLHPRDAAMGGLAFEIDENSTGQSAAREPAAWLGRGDRPLPRSSAPAAADVPDAIAIRIADLVVEKNRALFAADVRVDALVCTRSVDESGAHTGWTQKWAGIGDGERLALENGLLFLGPVRDFVDITLWVSRDAEGSFDLARLMAERANSSEFRDAASALLIGAGAVAAPWVAAVGASTVLARMAYELILGVAGQTIGLYRTSFLARERFGVGRHPAEGLYRAQDFSFSLVVEPVELGAAAG